MPTPFELWPEDGKKSRNMSLIWFFNFLLFIRILYNECCIRPQIYIHYISTFFWIAKALGN
jgi:hypothetical protein